MKESSTKASEMTANDFISMDLIKQIPQLMSQVRQICSTAL